MGNDDFLEQSKQYQKTACLHHTQIDAALVRNLRQQVLSPLDGTRDELRELDDVKRKGSAMHTLRGEEIHQCAEQDE